MINANKLRKTTEWERLENSLRELEIPREYLMQKMGTIDRNDMELTEAENIKKRWQEYTKLYKKDLHNPDNYDGVIMNLQPDILEGKVR